MLSARERERERESSTHIRVRPQSYPCTSNQLNEPPTQTTAPHLTAPGNRQKFVGCSCATLCSSSLFVYVLVYTHKRDWSAIDTNNNKNLTSRAHGSCSRLRKESLEFRHSTDSATIPRWWCLFVPSSPPSANLHPELSVCVP